MCLRRESAFPAATGGWHLACPLSSVQRPSNPLNSNSWRLHDATALSDQWFSIHHGYRIKMYVRFLRQVITPQVCLRAGIVFGHYPVADVQRLGFRIGWDGYHCTSSRLWWRMGDCNCSVVAIKFCNRDEQRSFTSYSRPAEFVCFEASGPKCPWLEWFQRCEHQREVLSAGKTCGRSCHILVSEWKVGTFLVLRKDVSCCSSKVGCREDWWLDCNTGRSLCGVCQGSRRHGGAWSHHNGLGTVPRTLGVGTKGRHFKLGFERRRAVKVWWQPKETVVENKAKSWLHLLDVVCRQFVRLLYATGGWHTASSPLYFVCSKLHSEEFAWQALGHGIILIFGIHWKALQQ